MVILDVLAVLALLLFEPVMNLLCCYLCYCLDQVRLSETMLLSYYLDHVSLCCLPCGYGFCFVHVLTYSSHAHNEGEPNTNRNIKLLCTFALIFVNAKTIYYNCDTTCVIVINKQKGGD